MNNIGDAMTKKKVQEIVEKFDKIFTTLEFSEQEIPVELVEGAALKVEDHTEMANKYLTDKAKVDFTRKATQPIVFEGDSSFQCLCLATQVKTTNIEVAVKKLSTIANELSEDGLIHSVLAPISSLELFKMPFQHQSSGVMCYLLIPSSKVAEIEEKYKDFITRENEMLKPMEDLGCE